MQGINPVNPLAHYRRAKKQDRSESPKAIPINPDLL
jgi:hypothetical protein